MPANFAISKLPEDVTVEQAVLGGCIAYRDQIPAVEAVCSPEDFYHSPHPDIARAIFELAQTDEPITPLTLFTVLRNCPAVVEAGGHSYIADLAMAAPVSGLVFNAKVVADLRQRRDALDALAQSEEAVVNRSISVMEAMRPAQAAADEATDRVSRQTEAPTHEASEALLRELEQAAEGKPVPRVTTGVACLDNALGGLQAGDFCIYAGRPGMLKTGLLCTSAVAAARAGTPVIFFEHEMAKKQLLARIGCAIDYESHPDDPMHYTWFRRGDVRGYQIERMAHALRRVPDNLRIIDRSGMTIHDISAVARGYAKRQKGLGLIVIDYLQLVQASDRYRGNLVQEVTEISKAAKTLAKQTEWAMLVAAQLSRSVEQREDKRPVLSDLRESGQIEQDADQVIMLFREAYYLEKELENPHCPRREEKLAEFESAKHTMELLVRKNRHGITTKATVRCDLPSSAIWDGAS